MLNFVEISNRIDHPELIKLEDLDKLRQLAERYPFTAIFSQLYLKGLSMHNTIQFEAELKKHAYRIPDRTQLFNLVHYVEEVLKQENGIEEAAKIEVEQRVEQAPQPIDEVVKEEIQEAAVEEVLIADEITKEEEKLSITSTSEAEAESKTVPEPEMEKEVEQFVAEEVEVEGVVNEENVDDTEESAIHFDIPEKKEVVKDLKRIGDLERDILAHAISSSIYLEVDKESEEVYSFARLKQLDKRKEFEEESAGIQFDLPPLESKEIIASKEEKEEVTGDKNFRTFTSWMNSSLGEEKSNILKEKERETPREEEKTTIKAEEKEKNKEILEVEKRKTEFFSPLQKARESLDESRLPVSETLAKVYAAQGNYPKAIDAYDKLILKFPEKKSFFALQIETLKRKLN